MKDSLEDRSDDFEQRLQTAGNTDELMTGLVNTIQQNRRVTRWLTYALIAGSLLMATITYTAFSANNTANRVDKNTAHLIRLAYDLKVENYGRCVESLERANRLNHFSDLMGSLEVTNSSITNELRAARIEAYNEIKRLPVPICTPPTPTK